MASDDAEDICRRMAELRCELASDVCEVSRSARVMTDWRFYVRRFPWAAVGVAAAAGFLLVPKRKEVQVISPDPNALAEMFKKQQLRVETPAHAKEQQGLMKTLLLMGITWAAKAGMNYMGERVRTAAVNKPHTAHAVHEPTSPMPAASPPPNLWPK
jgi:hypothetical protein